MRFGDIARHEEAGMRARLSFEAASAHALALRHAEREPQ